MKLKYLGGYLIAFLGLSLTIACKTSATPQVQTASATAGPVTASDPATAVTITGTVNFDGAPPKPKSIDMSSDPGCKGQTESEQLVVDNGHLANVLVYVKDGLGGRSFTPPQQVVTVKQQGCRYVPHIAAVMVGQPIRFEDDDQTLHNIHAMPKQSPQWNQSQMPNAPPLAKSFSNPEIMIPVKCNQHPWMYMYLNVLGNPFFAVTSNDGHFRLQGLPPGTYNIAAVQEKYGEKTQTITVGAKDQKSIDFSYHP